MRTFHDCLLFSWKTIDKSDMNCSQQATNTCRNESQTYIQAQEDTKLMQTETQISCTRLAHSQAQHCLSRRKAQPSSWIPLNSRK